MQDPQDFPRAVAAMITSLSFSLGETLRKKCLAPLHFLFSLMISEGLSRPGGEVLRGAKRWEHTFLHPFTLPPQKESTKNIYFCYNGGSKAPGHGRTIAFWPSAAPPRRVREEAARPGREGESLPLSSPSHPGSVHQSKFIHLLKSEGGQGT